MRSRFLVALLATLALPAFAHDYTLGALKIETDSTIPKYQRQLAFFSIYNKPAEPAKPVEAAKAP